MTTSRSAAAVLTTIALLSISSAPVFAQDKAAPAVEEADTDRDDGFDMGWLGLLGLAGLAGLRGRRHDTLRTGTTTGHH